MIKTLIMTVLMAVSFFTPVCASEYIATAYDLSYQSCGKSPGHPSYGVTASGFNLKGHTWKSARTVAADLRYHPLGTQLWISFPDPYKHMDGIYTVRDAGGGVLGNHLDIFFGENAHAEAIRFGRRTIYVTRM